MSKVTNKTITEFLDSDYREYSNYTLEHRAVPSVIDGFKPVQRKVIHIARKVWKTGSEKPMKVFQLTGKVSAECLEYDTLVHLANGETIKIGDWAENFPHVAMEVLCVDKDLNVTTSLGHSARFTKEVEELFEIEMEDGNLFRATGNHLVLLTSGVYKRVDELTEADEIKSILS